MECESRKKLEIYIHIPFCVKKCDYCDFLSFPATDEVIDRYLDALNTEMERFFATKEIFGQDSDSISNQKSELIVNSIKIVESNATIKNSHENEKNKYEIVSVFIGGGTPSRLSESQLTKLLNNLNEILFDESRNIILSRNFEFSMECNPGTLNPEKLRIMKENGVNRISIGLQSANNHELKLLGRIHNFEQFLESFKLAREAGFNNINVDLMSALPYQTLDSYKETLEKVISLNPEHISAYSLILEPGTKFYDNFTENKYPLPDEESERMMYYFSKEYLKKAGYERYEVSNYSKKGFECKHNIGYWNGTNYVGFGIGAASYIDSIRYKNTESLDEYIKSINNNQEVPKCEYEELVIKDLMAEFMILGLRMMKGISVIEFKNRFNVDIMEVFGRIIEKQILQGLLVHDNERLYLSDEGIDISNSIFCEYLP